MTPQGLIHHQHLQHIQGQHNLHQILQQQQHHYFLQQLNEHQDAGGQFKASSPLPSAYPTYIPNSAGDNQVGPSDKATLTPAVTALFNTAAAGGSSTCKWKPPVDCRVESLKPSLYLNSGIVKSCYFWQEQPCLHFLLISLTLLNALLFLFTINTCFYSFKNKGQNSARSAYYCLS